VKGALYGVRFIAQEVPAGRTGSAAAGFVASHYSNALGQAPAGVVYRALGKTGLKVSGVGCGIGLIPDPRFSFVR